MYQYVLRTMNGAFTIEANSFEDAINKFKIKYPNLTISKQKDFKYNPAKRDRFFERLKQSLSKGWFGFVDFLLFIINIWPFWIIVILILYFWKKYKMAKKKN